MAQHAPFPKTNKALLALIIPAMMAYSTQSTAQDANEPEVTLGTLNVTVNAKPKEEDARSSSFFMHVIPTPVWLY